MSRIDRTGTFRGVITQSGIVKSRENNLPMFVCQFRALEWYDNSEVGNEQWVDWSEFEECEITGRFCLVGKKGKVIGFQAENLMKALGWSGQVMEKLATLDCSSIQVQFRVENDTYDGKPRLNVAHIDHVDAQPGGTLQTLDIKAVRELDAKFAKAFRTFSGGPKPKAVGKPEKPQADPTKANSTKEPETKSPPLSDAPNGRKTEKPKKPSKPSKPPKDKKEEEDNCSLIAQHLNLPAEANEDEAWESVCQFRGDAFDDEHIEKTWLETIETLGGAEAIDEQKAWAKVRDVVVEKLTDDPPF